MPSPLENPEHLKVMFSNRRFYPDHDCIHGIENLDAFSQISGVYERGAEGRCYQVRTSAPRPGPPCLVTGSRPFHILIEKQIPPGTMERDDILAMIDYYVELMCRGLKTRKASDPE